MKDKLTSRKFWICVASALASLGTGISGIVVGNEKLAIAGAILTVISSSIYAFCEAWIDSKSASIPDIEILDLDKEDADDGK